MSQSTSPAVRTDRSGTPLIVDQPELQRRPHRMLYSILTLIAWVIWVYLWLPLVTLLAWYFGLRVFLREIVIPDPATMVAVGLAYGLVVLILGGALLVWSRYNVQRFRGKERREDVPPLSDQAVSEWFAVDPQTLARFRSQGSMTVQLDEHGMVQSLESEPARG